MTIIAILIKQNSVTILLRLVRFLYPTDQELRTLAGVPKEKPKKGNKHSDNGKTPDVFHVPRNLGITLESAKVSSLDVIHLKFYTEFQWLLDFSLYASMVYILTEVINHRSTTNELISSIRNHFSYFFSSQVYNFFYPMKEEFNLSMLWCALVLGFSLYPFQSFFQSTDPSCEIQVQEMIDISRLYRRLNSQFNETCGFYYSNNI